MWGGVAEWCLRSIGGSGWIGDGDINILPSGEVDDTCVGAQRAGVSLNRAGIAVALDGPSPTGKLEVIPPALCVGGDVSIAAEVRGGEDQRLHRKDSKHNAVILDSGLQEIDEGVQHSVMAVNEEELGGGAIEAVEWLFQNVNEFTTGT